jgi:leucyl-tRNA synthetase
VPLSVWLLTSLLIAVRTPQSTGNFITLRDACKEYSADATRFALADAGDGLEDANFERKSANAAILKLTKEEAWVREIIDWDTKNPSAKLRTGELNFFDQVFLNELNVCVQQADVAYSKLQFREALKYAWHQLQIERDLYKLAQDAEKQCERMHRDVLWRFFEVQAILLSPLCPHFCQHLWDITGLAKKDGRAEFVANARWPESTGVDAILARKATYLREVSGVLRRGLLESLMRFGKQQKPKAGEKVVPIEKWIADIAKQADLGMISSEAGKLLDSCTLYVAAEYPAWQVAVLKLISAVWDESGRSDASLPDRKSIIPRLKSLPNAGDKKALEASTKFANTVLEDLVVRGGAALELESPFNETELLQAHMDFVLRDLGIAAIKLTPSTEGPALVVPAPAQMTPAEQQVQIESLAASKALPGRPSPYFYKKSA